MGIRTPDLLHAMPGDSVRHSRAAADSGRSAGQNCPTASGSGRSSLSWLSFGQPLAPRTVAREAALPHGNKEYENTGARHGNGAANAIANRSGPSTENPSAHILSDC